MKNTIMICGTILVIFLAYFYLQFSETSKRAECASLISQREIQMKSKATTGSFVPSPYLDNLYGIKRNPAGGVLEPEPVLKETQFTVGGVPLNEFEREWGNDIYRMCLAQHGMKPEDLFK